MTARAKRPLIAGRKIALAHLSILDAPPPVFADAAATAGFDAVTLRFLPATSRDRSYDLNVGSPLFEATRERLEATGLEVIDVEAVRLRPESDIGSLAPVLEASALLGAGHVVVVSSDPDESRTTERFAALCEAASLHGIRPMLEFMVFTPVATIAHALRIVANAGHPAGGVLVDPLHLARSGGTVEEVARAVAADPGRFPYIQLCDAPAGAPGDTRELLEEAIENRLMPGEGSLPLSELLEGLPDGLALSVEIPNRGLAGVDPSERARRLATAVSTWAARRRIGTRR